MKKPEESISTMVNGIIHNDRYIFDMEETTLYGQKVYIAETVEGKKGFVKTPENYINTKFMLMEDVYENEDKKDTFIHVDYINQLVKEELDGER